MLLNFTSLKIKTKEVMSLITYKSGKGKDNGKA
jgi:hypothetical protein